MKFNVILFAVGMILTVGVAGQAQDVTIFDSNATISEGDVYSMVVVKGEGTVLEVTGGQIYKLIAMNGSIVDVSGGSISVLESYDMSVTNAVAGIIASVATYGDSEVVLAGEVGVHEIYCTGTSKVRVSEAAVVSQISVKANSEVYILGGAVDTLYSGLGDPYIEISGGNINGIATANYHGQIVVIGDNLSATPYGGNYLTGEITGNWKDGTVCNIPLGQGVYSLVTVSDSFPQSRCTDRPESDISGDCKVDMVDLAKMASEWLLEGTER